MLNIEDLDESLLQQLSQRAGDWGFDSVEEFLKAIAADPKKFEMGVSTPASTDLSIKTVTDFKHVPGVSTPNTTSPEGTTTAMEDQTGSAIKCATGVSTPSKKVLFQLKFECSEEFAARFDLKAQSDNRSRTGQAKHLIEKYAGMKALPTFA